MGFLLQYISFFSFPTIFLYCSYIDMSCIVVVVLAVLVKLSAPHEFAEVNVLTVRPISCKEIITTGKINSYVSDLYTSAGVSVASFSAGI